MGFGRTKVIKSCSVLKTVLPRIANIGSTTSQASNDSGLDSSSQVAAQEKSEPCRKAQTEHLQPDSLYQNGSIQRTSPQPPAMQKPCAPALQWTLGGRRGTEMTPVETSGGSGSVEAEPTHRYRGCGGGQGVLAPVTEAERRPPQVRSLGFGVLVPEKSSGPDPNHNHKADRALP